MNECSKVMEELKFVKKKFKLKLTYQLKDVLTEWNSIKERMIICNRGKRLTRFLMYVESRLSDKCLLEMKA